MDSEKDCVKNENPVQHNNARSGAYIIISLAAALAACLLPEFGFVSMAVLAACIIFNTSAKAPTLVLLIPIFGIIGVYFRGGVFALCVCAVLFCAATVAGRVLLGGGDFHRGLMSFTFVCFAAAAVGAAVYFGIKGITAEDIADYMKNAVHGIMAKLTESMGQRLSLDTAKLLTEQYEAIAYTAVVYTPSVIGCSIALLGVIALRLAGFLHDLTGCVTYPKEKRIAAVDRIFAVIYSLSLIIGSFDTGIVGACASNIMMILMIPAAAAGVSAYRIMLQNRRMAGRRGIPFSLVMLIVSFVVFSPVVGLMILSFTGIFAAFIKNSAFRNLH